MDGMARASATDMENHLSGNGVVRWQGSDKGQYGKVRHRITGNTHTSGYMIRCPASK